MPTMQKVFAEYQARQAVLAASTNPFANGVAWVDGELFSLQEARIPILDQGFMHSDLTYDVLSLPLPREKVKSTLVDMVAKSGIRDAFVEIIVTCGLKTIIARTVRRTPPGSMDPTVNNLQWGGLVRGLFEASDRGATYPFLTDTNLTEGSGFNVVLVKDGTLYRPARGVLEGVTLKSVIDAARKNDLEMRVEIAPPVRDGKLGSITKKIWDTYWAMHYEDAYSFEITYKE
ncbi:aminotransferase [Aspergillus heterothallicus]